MTAGSRSPASNRRGVRLAARIAACGLLAASVAGHTAPSPDLRALYARPPAAWPAASVDATVAFVELGPLSRHPPPNEARRRLGERLFHDPRLSATGQMSCATCHDPAQGWSNAQALPPGAPLSGRHVPALYSAAYRTSLGWDGATRSLGRQSLRPLLDPTEMGNPDLAGVAARVRRDPAYKPLAADAFGEAELDMAGIIEALVAFQSGLEEETRFDRFARGDHAALSDRELRGLHLFRTKAGCANCHVGPLLTDEGFHNLGLSAVDEPREDLGRWRVTGRDDDAGRFRTPSLRHVGRTAPYMHSGLFPTLEGVVNFYTRGGGDVATRSTAQARDPRHRAAARIDPLLAPLALDADEAAALVAFLKTL